MAFFCRKEQVQRITSSLQADGMRFMLVYGRHRVGKSELIKQCLSLSSVKSIYYECKQTSEQNNIESLCAVISDVLGLPRLGFLSIEETLSFLFKQTQR